MLGTFERKVGFAEGVAMSFDPDVLLPTAFAVTVQRGLGDVLVACRNEQLDRDFLKFRVDMFRVADGRIVWRFLLCDWKGVLDQLTAAT